MGNNRFIQKLGLVSITALTVFTVSAFVFQVENQTLEVEKLDYKDQTTVDLINELNERLENQEKVDAMIQAEVESGLYTSENPLVILDAYSQSPLTALICFTTDEPTRVDIHVEGEDEYTEVNHSFSEVTTQHIIPVYGLYPDKLNPVTVTVFSENGELVAETITEIQTEPVSDHFQSLIILTETFEEGYQDGINFLNMGDLAFDKNGDIRWYSTQISDLGYIEYHYGGNHFIRSKGSYGLGSVVFYEKDRMGKIFNVMYSPYGNHHDITVLPNDNLLVLGANNLGETIEDFIYEIDPNTGIIIHTIDMKYIIQRNRPAWVAGTSFAQIDRQDWMHMNSIVYDQTDQTIIISSNFQSCVVKMDWPSGDIHWVLGNHDDWNPRMQQYLITPIGDEFEWQYNQHAAEILPDYDNNPDTIDILLFDNGSTRFYQDEELQRQIRNNEIVAPELYSRLVHYRINEDTMEVEQIWQYGKERGLELFSETCSDSDLLENGNILGMFCHDHNGLASPVFAEVSKQSTLIWEAEIFKNTEDGLISEYRAERLPFYFDDDAEHDIYATARNLIPEDILQFVAEHNAAQ